MDCSPSCFPRENFHGGMVFSSLARLWQSLLGWPQARFFIAHSKASRLGPVSFWWVWRWRDLLQAWESPVSLPLILNDLFTPTLFAIFGDRSRRCALTKSFGSLAWEIFILLF